jgi:hypothetical protein
LKSWRDVLPVHPAADLFPLLPADELRALGEDIKANGLQSPVVLDDRRRHLVDGRNRLDAMELAGLETVSGDSSLTVPTVTAPSGADPYAYVISANVHRRHLTAEQKRDLIAKLLKARPETSNRRIGEEVKADDKTVGKVRKELEATAEIPQLDKTTGRDGKTRKLTVREHKARILKAAAGLRTAEPDDDMPGFLRRDKPSEGTPAHPPLSILAAEEQEIRKTEPAAPKSGDRGSVVALARGLELAGYEPSLQNKQDKLRLQNKRLLDRIKDLRARNKDLRARIALLESELAAERSAVSATPQNVA